MARTMISKRSSAKRAEHKGEPMKKFFAVIIVILVALNHLRHAVASGRSVWTYRGGPLQSGEFVQKEPDWAFAPGVPKSITTHVPASVANRLDD
ncbi:MAG: hypothetical protein CM1200mP9_10610 [Gammaproteobacteria bacterium]|nr:MAG: hypothetical protein CM1200mP9_10610 [Gammaproteobacteria bacterium]